MIYSKLLKNDTTAYLSEETLTRRDSTLAYDLTLFMITHLQLNLQSFFFLLTFFDLDKKPSLGEEICLTRV